MADPTVMISLTTALKTREHKSDDPIQLGPESLDSEDMHARGGSVVQPSQNKYW